MAEIWGRSPLRDIVWVGGAVHKCGARMTSTACDYTVVEAIQKEEGNNVADAAHLSGSSV